MMTPKRHKYLEARIRRIADKCGRAVTSSEVWRRVREAELFDQAELDEFAREGVTRAIERALQADQALRRRFEDDGLSALDNPFVRVRLQQLIEDDLARWEEGEGRR